MFDEAPEGKTFVEGKLAVVTGVTVGGLGYYIAEEIALTAGMDVILMGRSPQKLIAAEESIKKEASKRGIVDGSKLKLYHIGSFDLNDLESVKKAAKETQEDKCFE